MQKFNDHTEYDNYRKKTAQNSYAAVISLFLIAYVSYILFCLIGGNYFAMVQLISPIVLFIIVGIFLSLNKSQFEAFVIDYKRFRPKWHRFCIFIVVIDILNILYLISDFSRMYAFGFFDTTYTAFDTVNKIMVILYYVASFIALCWLANYMCCWLKTYRWEYEELTLTRTEKRMIIQEERKAYKQYKAETRKRNHVERKNKMENSWNNFKNNLSEEIDSIKSKCVPKKTTNPVTKYDKLQELNNLYNNGVISKEELEKARADILGK